MESDQHVHHLNKLVEDLTTSGKDKLDEDTFKKVKKICKQSDIYVVELYRLVSKQLKKKHAEIRFSAFQICHEIFCKSHCFRELLLKDFNNFIDLVLGLDPDKPPPKPHAVARKLQQKAIEAIQYWYDHFSEGYVSLKLAYNYLKNCKNVDFVELSARSEAERQRIAEERQKAEELKRKKVEKITKEVEDSKPEIKESLIQFKNCFKLLIPDVRDFFIALNEEENTEGQFIWEEEEKEEGGFLPETSHEEADDGEDVGYGSEFMRGHGITKETNIQINLADVNKVQETADNEVVVENLREIVNLLNTKTLPQIKQWEQTIRPYTEGNATLVRQIIDVKQAVQGAIKKFQSLNILPKQRTSVLVADEFDSDDDDDFIEVPFDDPRVVTAVASEAALLGMTSSSHGSSSSQHTDDPYNQPSTSGVTFPSTQTPQKKTKTESSSQAIRCPDEYLKKVGTAPRRHNNPLAGLSQVWTATPDLHEQEEVESTGGVLGVATQRVNYERAWEPVRWACRAPLPTGRLCPRRDREKCPFHGPIVPRDEMGQPLSPEDAARERARREQYERDHPAWQDPQLLAELKAATGIDLKVTKGRRKGKRRYENLTNINKTTVRERLAKKVLSKKAVRRVNVALAKETISAPNSSSDFNFSRN